MEIRAERHLRKTGRQAVSSGEIRRNLTRPGQKATRARREVFDDEKISADWVYRSHRTCGRRRNFQMHRSERASGLQEFPVSRRVDRLFGNGNGSGRADIVD